LAKTGFIKTRNGIFLGNVHDPLDLRIRWPSEYFAEGENEYDSRARFIKWMTTKTIGPPVATPENEVIDLRRMGYVGVYYNEEAGDIEISAELVDPTFPGGRTDVDFLGTHALENYKVRHDWME